jgi:hypothetical protein
MTRAAHREAKSASSTCSASLTISKAMREAAALGPSPQDSVATSQRAVSWST